MLGFAGCLVGGVAFFAGVFELKDEGKPSGFAAYLLESTGFLLGGETFLADAVLALTTGVVFLGAGLFFAAVFVCGNAPARCVVFGFDTAPGFGAAVAGFFGGSDLAPLIDFAGGGVDFLGASISLFCDPAVVINVLDGLGFGGV